MQAEALFVAGRLDQCKAKFEWYRGVDCLKFLEQPDSCDQKVT